MRSTGAVFASRRKLTGALITVVLTFGVALAALASAQATSTGNAGKAGAAATAGEPLTKLMESSAGKFGDHLTDGNGRAMYIFLKDTNGVSSCEGQCISMWPAVVVPAGADLSKLDPKLDASLLSSIKRSDGTMQLVFNGWPLYYYSGDKASGDENGQDVGDVWYLVTPKGTGAGIAAGQPGGGAAPK